MTDLGIINILDVGKKGTLDLQITQAKYQPQ